MLENPENGNKTFFILAEISDSVYLGIFWQSHDANLTYRHIS